MSLPLRLAIFEMGLMVNYDEDPTKVGGQARSLFMEFGSMFWEFNRTYVWVKDNAYGGAKINGTYTGMLRLFARNQSDVFLMPMPITAEGADVIEFGPIIKSTPTIFVQVMNVPTYDEELLAQLFRFSPEITAMLLIAVYCFARVLCKSEGAVRKRHSKAISFFDGVWSIIEMLLNQTRICPITLAGRLLVLMTAIGVFFWLQIWTSQMKTELTGYDTSQVAQTVDDLLFFNRTAIMTTTDPAERLVEHQARDQPDSTLGKIFAGARIISPPPEGKKVDPSALKKLVPPPEVASKHVLITSEALFSFLTPVACIWTPYDYLVGRETMLDSPHSPWYSLFLSREYKRILDRKYIRIRESGLFEKSLKTGVDMVPQLVHHFMGDEVKGGCTFRSLNDYLKKKEEEHPLLIYLRMSQMHSTFKLLCFAFAVSIVMLLLEKSGLIESASRKYRQINRNRKYRKIGISIPEETTIVDGGQRKVLFRVRNKKTGPITIAE